MTDISLIRPIDQPLGRRRLLHDLKTALQDSRFTNFRFVSAYARSGPLHRLHELVAEWRKAGKTSTVILGLDQQGTSIEALELALTLFDHVYVTQEPSIIFHPKMYLFKGKHHARAFVGSNNFTVGGTEKNFEAAVCLDLNLPEDAADLQMLELSFSELLPELCPATVQLDSTKLGQLIADNIVVSEKILHASASHQGAATGKHGQRSRLAIQPESPLPKQILTETGGTRATKTKKSTIARKHVIQIKPKKNGEILLSVSAALQNPEFFNWPFTGKTTPKISTNPSYPQLEPDPIVNIVVFGADPEPLLTLHKYELNTVYYERRSEIRITASPLFNVVPEYSVMIMERSNTSGVNYEITIHTPDSPDYDAWVSACDQQMPSGGRRPRKYGWF